MDFIKNMDNKVKYSIAVIVVIILGLFLFGGNKNSTDNKTVSEATTTKTTSTSKTVVKVPVGPSKNVMNRCNFRVTSPTMYSSVSMPFTVTGILDKADTTKGCIWDENASRAGNAEIFYNRRNEGWKSAGTAVPIITRVVPGGATTTMAFSVTFNLYTAALGLTSGTPIKVVFTELNIPEHANPDSFDFLVSLK